MKLTKSIISLFLLPVMLSVGSQGCTPTVTPAGNSAHAAGTEVDNSRTPAGNDNTKEAGPNGTGK